jgi:hypothetical protein
MKQIPNEVYLLRSQDFRSFLPAFAAATFDEAALESDFLN